MLQLGLGLGLGTGNEYCMAFFFFFSYLKVTNAFVLPSWAEAWCKCDIMLFIRDCLHGSLPLGGLCLILGIIGAPENQQLCWHNRYTFLIRWPEHCNLF